MTERPDHGSKLLARRLKVVADRELATAGGECGARVAAECLLDALRNGSLLGPPDSDDAARRHEAGLWFRRLYSRCRLASSVTMAYEVFGRDTSDPSDVEDEATSWNRKCLRETMLELGRFAHLVRAVCAFDHAPSFAHGTDVDLCRGLDRLADIRGIE